MTNIPGSAAGDLYEATHRHPANRTLHAIGIPLIACCGIAAFLGPRVVGVSRRTAIAGVAAGSALLVLGHAIEGNRPAIFTSRSAILEAVKWWGRGAASGCRRALRS